MTKWNKDNFNYSGGYLTYYRPGLTSEFVARFKYRGGMVTMGVFKKALMKSSMSPDQYFKLMEDRNNTPVGILEADGVLSFDYETMTTFVAGKAVRKLR